MRSPRYKLTKSQQAQLIRNPNVRKVSAHTVQYTAAFKKKMLHDVKKGRLAHNVFREAEIPIEWFNWDYARVTLRDWKKVVREHGEEHFDEDRRGSRMREQKAYKHMTDKEKVLHLEMKVEALEYTRRHFQLPPAILWKPHHSRRRQSTK